MRIDKDYRNRPLPVGSAKGGAFTPKELIEYILIDRGWNMAELAERSGVSVSTIWRIVEKGQNPHYTTMEKIRKYKRSAKRKLKESKAL